MTNFFITMLLVSGAICTLLTLGALFEFGISKIERSLKRKKYRKYRYDYKKFYNK